MSDRYIVLRRKERRLQRRRKHSKKRIRLAPDRPRMVVYRSNRHIYVQIVDDFNRRTITGCSSLTPVVREKLNGAQTKVDQAKVVGEHIALLAKGKGIEKVAFDRNGCKYHGRVKALVESARSGGLKV